MNTKLHGIDAWNEDVARQDAKQSGKLTKQEIEQRLLALGAQQVAMPKTFIKLLENRLTNHAQ